MVKYIVCLGCVCVCLSVIMGMPVGVYVYYQGMSVGLCVYLVGMPDV